MNPANVPQLHPIEIFGANMKCELQEGQNCGRHQSISVENCPLKAHANCPHKKLRKYCKQLEDNVF